MDIFDDLFALELASNHQGDLERGKEIVRQHGAVARANGVRAAFKLQLRDVPTFVHPEFKSRQDIRYVQRTMSRILPTEDFRELARFIQDQGFILMATSFDEPSVAFACEIGCEILKVASSDINDIPLLECIAAIGKPVIASTGGASLEDMDWLVEFFDHRGIPLAVNHCVSLYPSEDGDLELNQLDFMRERYPFVTLGFSSHEYLDWRASIQIAYAKGARTFERHVDIETQDTKVSPYCSLPGQVDQWFKAWAQAKAMCGGPGTEKRVPSRREVEYLDALVRGCYATRDLPAGHVLEPDDIFLAIPLLQGQTSCREMVIGQPILEAVVKDKPITLASLGGGFTGAALQNRGLAS